MSETPDNKETPDKYVTRLVGGGFAGLGGPALVCLRCGCLLPLEDAACQVHDKWHTSLDESLVMPAKGLDEKDGQ